ncbi:MAG: tRNA-dihydrouridine synthase [Caldilineaceae bacterium]|nr:tRNA-dihydrouridine synthase [Caldilineaceae bacterium]
MSQSTNFWATLPRPIIGLSPMNGVTDHAFRHIQKKHGNPMLLFTEFTSVDGICAGASALLKDFLYDESQRPIIAQIYGRSPRNFYQTAVLLCQLGFDGIDINMGCPSKSIAHAGSGAGLIRTPQLAQEIVRATQRGVHDWMNGATVRECVDVPKALADEIEARHRRLPLAFQQRRPIPVSVKTRIGYATSQVREWIPQLLESEPAAISLHGRTLTQGYTGESNWDEIGCAAEVARGSGTLILGNGDLLSLDDAYGRIVRYGVDGALIGRASYGNPYVFRQEGSPAQWEPVGRAPTPSQENERYDILHIALEHARLYEESFSHLNGYRFLPMRKHLGWYVRHLPGASHLRRTLTQTSSLDESVATIEQYLAYRQGWDREAMLHRQ